MGVGGKEGVVEGRRRFGREGGGMSGRVGEEERETVY